MKSITLNGVAHIMFLLIFLVGTAVIPQQAVQAQESDYPEASQNFTREELAQMLAPIALYPDALLSQILMASTYPIEIIEADRWVRKNPELKGDALDEALLAQEWDPSVKALCHFPSVLALMSQRISETTNIGNAFLAQEDEVMNMIQELRARAYANGNLATNSEQKIVVEKETIIIEPADPRVVYVPYYDPYTIYGPWWYPAYPPYYWGPSGVNIGIGISYWPGFYFGFAFGNWSYFDWHRHTIYIDVHKRPRYVRHDRWWTEPGRWHHTPRHRRGVAYRDKPTARKYGQYPGRTRNFSPDTRGFPESRSRYREGGQQYGGRGRVERVPENDRTGIDRMRQQPRTLPETQARRRIEPDRVKQRPPEAQPMTRQRSETRTQAREQVHAPIPERQRIEPRTQVQQRIEPPTQMQQRIEPRTLERQRLETQTQIRQMQQRQDQIRQLQQRQDQIRQRIQRGQSVPPENVFNRVEQGGMERQSSERGRSSRQRPGYESRGRGGSGGDNRSSRGSRGNNR